MGLTGLSSQSSLQHYTFVLQLLEGHLNLLQSPLDGLRTTETKKSKEGGSANFDKYITSFMMLFMVAIFHIQYDYIP